MHREIFGVCSVLLIALSNPVMGAVEITSASAVVPVTDFQSKSLPKYKNLIKTTCQKTANGGYACNEIKTSPTKKAAKTSPKPTNSSIKTTCQKNANGGYTCKEIPKKANKKNNVTKTTSQTQPPKPTQDFHSTSSETIKNNVKNSNINTLVASPVISAEKITKDTSIGHPYLGIMAGAGFAKIGERQYGTYTDPTEHDEYIPTSKNSVVVVSGINGGYEFKVGSNGLLSLGVGGYYNSGYRLEGEFWDKDPIEGTAHMTDYEYKLQSMRFMFESQFAWMFGLREKKLIPFISLGIGSALNYAGDFKETVVDQQADLKVPFKSHRCASFAYQLGLGLAYQFNMDRNRLFIAYRYVDLGKAFLDENGVRDYKLDVSKIKVNEVYIGYSRFFNF